MPETIDPIEDMAARYNAERFLRERAEATANRAALDSRSGRQPETYDDPWENVQADFQRRFPTVPLAPAAQLFQQTRDASFRQGLTRAPAGGEIDIPRAVAQRTPIAGGLIEAGVQGGISNAARRIRDGGATQEDYIAVGRDASNSEAFGNLGVVGQGLNIASMAPSIGVEFLATGGLGSAASGAARQGLARVAPSVAGGFAERAVGVGASVASRTALSPSMNASNIARELAPSIQVGPDGVRVGQDPGVVGAIARGVADTGIEIASEMSGGLLGRFGNPGGRLGATLRRMGYNGMAGEVFEERVGEVLRGLSGVEDNFGMTGNIASGNFGAAFRQLGSEIIGFGLYGGALQTANRIASGQVPPDGGPSIRVVPPLGDAPTREQEEQHARATATAGERNARVVADWITTAPLEEVERWRGWYGIDQDMIDARRELDLDRAREVADSIAAVTSAVSQVARPDRRAPVDILGVATTNDPAGTQRPEAAPEAENPIGNSSSSPEVAQGTPDAAQVASETPEATSVAQTAPNAAAATPGALPATGNISSSDPMTELVAEFPGRSKIKFADPTTGTEMRGEVVGHVVNEDGSRQLRVKWSDGVDGIIPANPSMVTRVGGRSSSKLPPITPDSGRLIHFTNPEGVRGIIESGVFRSKGGIASTSQAFSTPEQVDEAIKAPLAGGRYGKIALVMDVNWDQLKEYERSFATSIPAGHVVGWYDTSTGKFTQNPARNASPQPLTNSGIPENRNPVKITPAVKKSVAMASASLGDDILPLSQALEKTNAKRKKQGQKPLTEKAWADVVQAMVQDGKAVLFTETPDAIAAEKAQLDADQKALADLSELVHREGRGPQAPEWKIMSDIRANIAKARQIIAFGPGTFLHRPDVVPPRGLYAEAARTPERSAPAAAPPVSQPALQAGRGAESPVREAGPGAGASEAVAVDPQGASAEGVSSTGKISNRGEFQRTLYPETDQGVLPTFAEHVFAAQRKRSNYGRRVPKRVYRPGLYDWTAHQQEVTYALMRANGESQAKLDSLGLRSEAVARAAAKPIPSEALSVVRKEGKGKDVAWYQRSVWDLTAYMNSTPLFRMSEQGKALDEWWTTWEREAFTDAERESQRKQVEAEIAILEQGPTSFGKYRRSRRKDPDAKAMENRFFTAEAEAMKNGGLTVYEYVRSQGGFNFENFVAVMGRGETNALMEAVPRDFWNFNGGLRIEDSLQGGGIAEMVLGVTGEAAERSGRGEDAIGQAIMDAVITHKTIVEGMDAEIEREYAEQERQDQLATLEMVREYMMENRNASREEAERAVQATRDEIGGVATPEGISDAEIDARQKAATAQDMSGYEPGEEQNYSSAEEPGILFMASSADMLYPYEPSNPSSLRWAKRKAKLLAQDKALEYGATGLARKLQSYEQGQTNESDPNFERKLPDLDRELNRQIIQKVRELFPQASRAYTQATPATVQWWTEHIEQSQEEGLEAKIRDVYERVEAGIPFEEETLAVGPESIVASYDIEAEDLVESFLDPETNPNKRIRQVIADAGGISLERMQTTYGKEIVADMRSLLGSANFNRMVKKKATLSVDDMARKLIEDGAIPAPLESKRGKEGVWLLEQIISNELSLVEKATSEEQKEAQNERRKGKTTAATEQAILAGEAASDAGAAEREAEGTPRQDQSQDGLSLANQPSPAHAELAGILSKGIQANPNLSKANAKAYAAASAEVLSSLSNERAARIAPKLRKAKFFNSTQELGGYLSLEFPKANVLVEDGKELGGAFHIVNGTIYLDGGVKEAMTSGVYAHEMAHPEFLSVPAKDRSTWSQIWSGKIANGDLGDYAQTDSEEGFCEFARHLFENSGDLEAVRAKFPTEYAFFEVRGMLPQGGEGRVAAFKELFSEKVADGPLVGDVLLNKGEAKFMASGSTGNFSSRAAEQVSREGTAEPKNVPTARDSVEDAVFNRYGAARRLELARIKSGQTASKKGRDLETILSAIATFNPHALDQMITKGVYTFVRTPDGGWQQNTISGPFREVIKNLSKDDLKADASGNEGRFGTFILARHVIAEFQRGLEMLNSEHETVRAKGLKKTQLVSYEQRQAFAEFLEETDKKHPEWLRKATQSADSYTQFMNATMQALVETGFYTQDAVDRMISDKPEYANLARIQENQDYKPGVKQTRTGSARRLISPMVTARSRMGLTGYLMHRQLANYALWEGGSQLANGKRGVEGQWEETDKKAPTPAEGDITGLERTLEAMGLDEWERAEMIAFITPEVLPYISSPAWKDNGENTYTMRIDGKPVVIKVHDKLLHDMLTGNQGANSQMYQAAKAIAAVRGMKGMNQAVKFGATTGNMVFSPKNLIRDPWHYYQNALKDGTGFLDATVNLLAGIGAVHKAKYQMLRGKETTNPWADLYFQAGGEKNRAFFYVPVGPGEAVWREVRGEERGPVKEKAVKALEKGRQLLELYSAGEHGPRLAEFTKALKELGYTEAKIKSALDASPDAMPIPFNDLAYAMKKGSEATTPFQKTGYAVSQWNKVAPFFGAHVAAMAQEGRNWRDAVKELQSGRVGPRMKAMAGVLAGFIALEVLHWLAFKDEDWYPELDANQRYNWWILRKDASGAVWGVPKPQGLIRMAGGFLTESLRSGSGDAASFGMATTAARQVATPRLLPAGIGEAIDVSRNTAWHGGPIVPDREEHDAWWSKAWRYQGPYILNQMTGGMASSRILRGPHEAFMASETAPHQSVKTLRDMFEEVQGLRSRHDQANGVFAREAEYRSLRSAVDRLNDLARRARNSKDPEIQRDARERQVEVARGVLSRLR